MSAQVLAWRFSPVEAQYGSAIVAAIVLISAWARRPPRGSGVSERRLHHADSSAFRHAMRALSSGVADDTFAVFDRHGRVSGAAPLLGYLNALFGSRRFQRSPGLKSSPNT
jgi:hypothetical protein